MESRHVLFVLASASQAIKGEAALRAAGVAGALVPVPRTLSGQCGVCLRVAADDRVKAEAVLTESGTAIAVIHEVEAGAGQTAAPPKETP